MKTYIPAKFKYFKRKIHSNWNNTWRDISNRNVVITNNPIFILGNQKSGTSAVAALLSELTNVSVCIDLRKEVWSPSYHEVLEGKITFARFVERNHVDFSKDIIKEPNLTFLHHDLFELFPSSKVVFIVRDPRSNIKSILNRLSIPGSLDSLTKEYRSTLPYAWKLILDNRGLDVKTDNKNSYIEALAYRWNFASNVLTKYLQVEACTSCNLTRRSGRYFLIRYEDFINDKVGELEKLAYGLELEPVNDISEKVNVQFQPRGENHVDWKRKDTNWKDFFGTNNLTKIETICQSNMEKFGYQISS